MQQIKYPMLGEKFCSWYEEEFTNVWDEWHGYSVPEGMLEELKLNGKEYFDKFIRPYLGLTQEHLHITLGILASRLKDRLTPQPSPFCLNFKVVVSPKINALEWLLVHIADLKYFEFSDFVKSKYEKPHNQCMICGKPDFYEKEITKGEKKIKIEFSSKRKYCHVLGCSEDNPNPSDHTDGCHYKEWAYVKKSMNQKLSRYLKQLKILKTQTPIDIDDEEKINEKIKQIEEKFCNFFENFYKEQYKKNLKIPYTIRAKDCEVFDLREFGS